MSTTACDADMDLRELLAGMAAPLPAVDVADIASHSGAVVRGGLFLACLGTRQHGLRFLSDALARGASAVAWEPAPAVLAPSLSPQVVSIEVPQLHRRLGDIANRFFAGPSHALSVCGVTGTNGKTTVAWLVTQALGQLGRRAGYMGTLGYGVGTRVTADTLTTADCVTVHRRLRDFAAAGASHCVAEVSSHALDQGRVDGVLFRVVAFTNLTRDHLDYHGSVEAYGRAKAQLFLERSPQHAVINVGDDFGRGLAARLPRATQLISVAVACHNAPTLEAALVAQRLYEGPAGQRIRLSGDYGSAEFMSPLWGAFNTENLAVAAGVLCAQGFKLDEIAVALAASDGPPGRMERIAAGGPQVVIDFAHTPDALRRVLQALREHVAGNMWCVFGCGGERDRGKRADMGAVARRFADRIVITNDNPRREDPEAIIADILAGTGTGATVEVVQDRAEAIRRAVYAAGPADLVLIAGKGHETVQIVGAESHPFSDRAIARSALDQRA
jgi:UDP-N-acetylmuramoyl-L-alanyl-D-glutamate--2,6-diaminopimelate ligase